MPLDDTLAKSKPAKAKPVRLADALLELDHTLVALLARATTIKDKLNLEVWASSEAERLAGAWRVKAKSAAVAGNAMPDLSANPLPAGTSETVYSSKLLTIGLKVVRQADRTDVPGLVAYLEKAGVKPALLKRAVKRHTNSMGVANIFTALLVKS